MSKYDNYISSVKGIGIILMVVGHSGCPEILNRLIYYFHMPLFFFCSGYFFIPSKGEGKNLIVKRIKRIYVPYLKWSLAFLLLHNVFYSIGLYNQYFGYGDYGFARYSILDFSKRFMYVVFTMDRHEPLLGGFWFMKTLFLSSVFVIILTCYSRRTKASPLCMFVLLLILLMLCKYYQISIPLIGDISIIVMGGFFYLLGSVYKRFERVYLYNVPLLILMGVSLFLFSCLYHNMSMFCKFQDCLLYLVVALLSIYLTFGVAYHLEKTSVKKVFYYIGKQTLQILALHFLAFKIVSVLVVKYYVLPLERLSELPVVTVYNEYTWYLYSVVGIVVPLLLSKGYRTIIAAMDLNTLNKQ